ncbi:hypothetical protein AKJ65_00110 [candidate division MSBL1 archaeon SCGC-AAA259E19]|uniref:Xylose isomerase-like TIM barrel domain-containing protein n=1 Tax=candidate division MSBL1 archaeon SCGC-AAA259E19 TaxID=1698264 RepID=A0A133UNX1_9EURY|nr:hypothetical protein AKJ65_00110 [candidate division MSBL1 archaeon SCGC-AAA259E19]
MWTTKFTEEDLYVFNEAKELGFDGIEIDMGSPDKLPIEEIKQKMDETKLECTFSLGLEKNKA